MGKYAPAHEMQGHEACSSPVAASRALLDLPDGGPLPGVLGPASLSKRGVAGGSYHLEAWTPPLKHCADDLGLHRPGEGTPSAPTI